ncbi:uncharacterized protein PHACADRAFT_193855 [Phanerochaete carnosa HHB-10118-sp]|uniref:Uncharacterized protein n=1 Tax=Phanerochaete carnosa (strain HHB-10118-sp) TaxID=650164 RepID=K5V7J7_PHACS|nr:uncharacterized protein PHACADRAFT_193855 [Phanerochaete carnosa HHB-10118-sp]EKM58746.1 hypothetical protein PHACADRAFT_193855 [Phanerochaete carnosa HHB-10118-sp]
MIATQYSFTVNFFPETTSCIQRWQHHVASVGHLPRFELPWGGYYEEPESLPEDPPIGSQFAQDFNQEIEHANDNDHPAASLYLAELEEEVQGADNRWLLPSPEILTISLTSSPTYYCSRTLSLSISWKAERALSNKAAARPDVAEATAYQAALDESVDAVETEHMECEK